MNNITKKEDLKINQALNFLEDLLWILDSKKINDLKDSPNIMRKLLSRENFNEVSSKYASINQNKNMLVGILPNFLQDAEIFKTNIDIADFAKNVLKIDISRPDKRSKYELIGLIACEVNNLDDSDLSMLVDALLSLTNTSDGIVRLKEAKKISGFSWSEFLENI